MTKEEFLRALEDKIDSLDHADIEDVLNEYEEKIDDLIKAGISEKEAVKKLGDIDSIAKNVLLIHKKEKDFVGDSHKRVIGVISQLIDDFSNKSLKDICRFIFEIVFIILVIALFKIPVLMLENLGKDFFNILSSPLNRIFYYIWKFILEFAYFILAILSFGRIFSKRYIKKPLKDAPTKVFPIGESLIKICIILIKFIVVFILFGLSCYLIGMTLVIGVCVYLLIKGVSYYGLYLIMLSLWLFGVIFFSILFNFVLDNKNNGVTLFRNIMLTIVILGVGCVLTTFEVADTEFINGVPNDLSLEVLTQEVSMTDNTVFIGNVANYNVDNSLDTVKVTFEYYPLVTEMSTDISKDGNLVYLNYSWAKINIKKELIEHIIEDLKVKKVYNYNIEPTITITASEENIEIIKQNRQNYYDNVNNYTACEFVRTYTVVKLGEVLNGEVNVVLSEYLSDDWGYIKLPQSLADILVEGSTYEFTFKTYQTYIDTDIEDVFADNEVISISKTTKTGILQRQDSSCSTFY